MRSSIWRPCRRHPQGRSSADSEVSGSAQRELGPDSRVDLRTDYAFETVDDAAQTLGFFFGEKMEQRIRARQWARVPECTGVYRRAR